MGTRWRGLLAPVNTPTDDGRRFKTFTYRTLPLGLKWQRVDAEGHDSSVVVGSLESVNIGTLQQAVDAGWISQAKGAESKMDPNAQGAWGSGEMFDDVDTAAMPRLAEDVAEATELLSRGVISPSVDPIPVGAVFLVEPGSDEPITDERWDEMFMESITTGIDPPIEVLFEEGLIAAATLVVTPAFSEVRPFELATDDGTQAPMPESQAAALVAAATPTMPPAELFAAPAFAGYTEIAVTRRPDGLLQIAGHFAPHGTCHLEFRDMCVTAPVSAADYVPFHRYPVQLADGELIGVGRLTTGYGKVGTGCRCCPGKDDHACTALSMADTIRHYDKLTTLAWVRAGEDEHGLWVAGVVADGADSDALAVLSGRKFSGDWREHGAGMELVEVLALTVGKPGFPAPRTAMRGGRQSALVAAFRPPTPAAATAPAKTIARQIADMVVADLRATPATVTVTAADGGDQADTAETPPEHTGAMVALRMTDEHANRLAVEGGEPSDQLHLTLAYLGEAADIPEDTQQAIIEALRSLVAGAQEQANDYQIVGDGFSVSAFNPNSEEKDTAIVLGVSGAQVDGTHDAVMDAVTGAFDALPEQHAPWAAHVTLAYSDDLSLVERLADRTGELVFDRLRVAFAGQNTDIPLSAAAQQEEAPEEKDSAASLLSEVEAALASIDDDDRAREVARLSAEIEEVSSGV